ncbi:Ubiquitin carboxyl-terminal hydrolase 5 [Danaus plexippus plexippus]|uniref:ubiquitinyl hydrolase 1 n=1 Tax=Danaus plexippus plexippus TaxID=278856 RepID=A0A212FBH3_DANPL|nr:Ubiquitin carboxyl-terminal hydrolase 5 [Danaus plexippus plexippus]
MSEIPEPEQTGDGPEKKITRLAIGVEGGFDPDCGKPKYTYTEHYSVVVLPGFHTFPWPNDALPDVVKKSVQAVLDADSPFKLAEAEALHGTWDGEKREVSVHSVNLKQLDNGVKIPPSGWKCAKCDLTNNLWLNLTDGSILCGRRFFDGSGGNDHAVEHFRATGYPLAVKLGTITADGTGDVYSYAEDDMVEDPYLAEHLKHFGINVQQLQKTEKSMVELELELNRRTGEWNTIQESGSELRPLHGPALTGVNNLGNSCYINSVVQVLFRMPDFIRRYVEGAPEIFSTFPEDPANDFNVQTDPSEVVRPLIPFQACLDAFMKEELIEQFFSSALNKKVTARKITRLATFPDYLWIQLKKFTIKEDWTPAKLDVAVDMPWEVGVIVIVPKQTFF